jgi:hypothetical protein
MLTDYEDSVMVHHKNLRDLRSFYTHIQYSVLQKGLRNGMCFGLWTVNLSKIKVENTYLDFIVIPIY